MEWELSKENVLPKKNGRSVSKLVSALQPQGDHQIQLRTMKHKFEEELRAYSGDDPLDVWYRYISWIEENYPRGGKKDLSSILKSCMEVFCEEEKYKNDPRYVDVWIKFANLYETPELMYGHMRDQGIGCQCAAFYEAWASHLELLGNSKKADIIFTEGLKCNAQPADVLLRRHQEFQNRTVLGMMKRSTLTSDDPAVEAPMDVENRVAFTGLEARGKKKEIPSIRPGHTGLVRTDARVPIAGKARPLQKGSTFQIYSDENSEPVRGTIIPNSKAMEYQRVPVRSTANSENSKIPGPWTKNKISQKKSFPVIQSAPFEVQTDGSSEMMNLRKCPEFDSQMLSVRKPEKDGSVQPHHSNPMQPVFGTGFFQRPMYCKDKIYAGCEEYSFEELRDLRWRRKQQARESQAIEENIKRMMEQQQQILLRNQEIMRQHEAMQEELMMKRKFMEEELMKQKFMEEELMKQKQLNGIEISKNLLDAIEKDQASGEGVNNNSVNRSGDLGSSLNNSNLKNNSRNSSQSSSFQTGSNSSFHNKKSGKKSLGAPSPTVNTIEALQVVRGFYNASINFGKDSTIDDEPDENPSEVFQDVAAAAPKPVAGPPVLSMAPFMICEDEPQHPALAPVLNDLQPEPNRESGLEIFCDEEPVSNAMQHMTLQENKMNDDPQPSRYRLQMPDMDDITLGLGSGMPQIPQSSSIFGASDNDKLTNENDFTNISKQPMPLKNFSSTPAHFGSIGGSHPDFANMSTISGTTCATTENTIIMEQPTLKQNWEISNKTAGLSPIKEGSTESTHSSLESRTLGASHHSSHHATQLHSTKVKSNVVNEPFSKSHQQNVLANLATPLQYLDNFHIVNQPCPVFRVGPEISNGLWSGTIVEQIAKGGNGQIFKMAVESTFALDIGLINAAVKVQKPACPWEFYICNEIQQRTKRLPSPKAMSSCFMSINDGFFYEDGSVLISQFYEYGTILDLVNKHQSDPKYSSTCESSAVYILIELLTIVDHLHKCQIIHGDIKPDNILLRLRSAGQLIGNMDLKTPKLLTLIDLGESIDMNTHPDGTVFTGKVLTSGFQCVEMKTECPWTYQTDLYGILGTIHVILFGKYMKIFNSNGKWQTTSNFQRKWNVPLWKQLFHDFLNIPSCDKIPNLLTTRDLFIDYFKSSLINSFRNSFIFQ